MSQISFVDHRHANGQRKLMLDAAQAQPGTLAVANDVPNVDPGGW